ncbi:bark storage protein A isoform X1 [Ricinus communis]|nr:bark storage protein A isoform X1 [Ricinus communis]XP_048226223.1 bark storage protein A isoform X1 [Ricinus communis]XP_048226224.1 bark storage protein A isoform X1 [Ricinus communis]XP_048226225.1 bark storage protein A isoform X1 [Ricinus communis]XP_048226226.1 bark storage protein A isoform X1 [Ricinus communis]XP_048226227.1 bark storage protein A isoform X1 [Ricinus communis]XP_048226228.1 bark storage protein A isoform X1 [Ricinus communis]
MQILADNFKLRGIINFGSAGATNETLSIGSVFVPSLITFSGTWEWLSMNSSYIGQLQFGQFNYPKNGENLLGSVKYGLIDVYENGRLGVRQYIPDSQSWLRIASRIEEVDSADVVIGLKSSSSDIFVNNPAYREFLYKTFGVSTVDTSSAAVGLAAKSYGLDFIVFRGVSNYAGAGDSAQSASELANANAVKAVTRFIWLATVPRSGI